MDVNQKVTKSKETKIAISQAQQNKKNEWDQRKLLMIQINSKTQQLFQKIDYDYSQLFKQLGVFQHLIGGSSEVKGQFFEQNYQKILIHFFQYLFDFEIQTLIFKEKCETILSFVEWIQNQVVFQMPSQIKFLNKRKKQSKLICHLENQKAEQNKKANIVSKRTIIQSNGSENQKQIRDISSPKKKKIVEKQFNELCFIDFPSKYQDLTNHTTFNTTPRCSQIKNSQLSSRVKQKDEENQSQLPRIFLKVTTEGQISKPDCTRIHQKCKKKQTYRLKPDFKLKRLQLVSNKILIQPQNCKEIIQEIKQEIKEPKQIKKRQKYSYTQFQKKSLLISQKKNQIDQPKLQVEKQIKFGQNIEQQYFQSHVLQSQQLRVRSSITNSLIRLDASLSQSNAQQKNSVEQLQSKDLSKILRMNQINCEQFKLQRMKSIVQQMNMASNTKKIKKCQNIAYLQQMPLQQKLQEQISSEQKSLVQKQARKVHNIKARLSGLFRYSQKRYYIFPDMAQTTVSYNQIQQSKDKKKPKTKSKSKGQDETKIMKKNE